VEAKYDQEPIGVESGGGNGGQEQVVKGGAERGGPATKGPVKEGQEMRKRERTFEASRKGVRKKRERGNGELSIVSSK